MKSRQDRPNRLRWIEAAGIVVALSLSSWVLIIGTGWLVFSAAKWGFGSNKTDVVSR